MLTMIGMLIGTFGPGQPSGWSMKRYLKSSRRRPPSLASAKYQISCRFDGPLPVSKSSLVVAVEMDLVGRAAEVLAGLQLVDDVRVAGRRHESREPVETGKDAVLDLARGTLPGQRMIAGTRKPPS